MINHILVFLFLIVVRIYVFFDTKRLKEAIDPAAKEKTYYKLFAVYWGTVICLMLFSDLPHFYPYEIFFNITWTILAYLAAIYIFINQVIPVILISFSSKFREMTSASFDKKSYVFPTTTRQRYIFIIVPITVGICEEIIFRGFLFQYFQASPYGLSALLSLLICTVIFGLGHYQQGLSGIVETLILGYLLGFLYLVTGSLLLPIIIHILYDFKILYISHKLKNI
ncbi:CPBP family intramembrane metalloprotease [Paenibacillus psychroresistens]|uniref:CPBP family intramembrane metalloprotease n=1 Tax=Paenibacillus psychroresistens TaxID=1778678 RepID=A0A6B8RLP6_9BACL|nr:CPBP family intramembrane glutamic endopeptidase [Paenibacillus psychroresistens]QGQ96767.1 CPBP family intramembrane metalloprotease [Paenibacillus psychroresistens]